MPNPSEIWRCVKRACRWQGRYEELAQVPDRELGAGVSKGVCPKCGHDTFHVKHRLRSAVGNAHVQLDLFTTALL